MSRGAVPMECPLCGQMVLMDTVTETFRMHYIRGSLETCPGRVGDAKQDRRS